MRGLELADAGARTVMQVGPIGSRLDYLTLWLTKAGPRLQTGCFFGTFEEFISALTKTHTQNGLDTHWKEYTAALVLMEEHARLWAPS